MILAEPPDLNMQDGTDPSPITEQQARALLLFMVVVSYFITFTIASGSHVQYKLPGLILGIVMGAVYAILGVFEVEILGPLGPRLRGPVFFTVQIALVLGVGWMLGPGGNWFMGLPLAGMAMYNLRPRWRWPVYGGVLAAGLIPIIREHPSWQVILMNAMIITAAILFTGIVSQYRLIDRAAREQAESMAKRLEEANRKLAALMRADAGGIAGRAGDLEEPLSARELEVLALVAAGMSNREIAERLVISTGTAKTHIHHVCGKLGVRNRTEAAMKARELQLI